MEVNPNWKVSLLSFVLGTTILVVPATGFISQALQFMVEDYWRYLLAGHAALVNAVLLFVYRGQAYQVALRGCFLGLIFGLGIILSLSGVGWSHFGWYMAVLSFFHWSEYFTTAVTNPKHLTLESYLLDHSREYHLAAMASWLEFFVEYYIFPGMKQLWLVSFIGLLIVAGGETLRKGAMITARTNFNHYVQHIKQDGHILVTHGVYSMFRHPSYVGWFYWSIGTQMILVNPVCTAVYALVSWKFFKLRIETEEVTLLNFFGEEYIDYQKRVGTGLPGIKGWRVEL